LIALRIDLVYGDGERIPWKIGTWLGAADLGQETLYGRGAGEVDLLPLASQNVLKNSKV
jgi:hypothetical protein